MKGLLKFLSPFAPDQSGAVSVLYGLDGITVICDAGGCTGNICGFDEPRWFQKKSALFSAGLRDMDAILGRDDKLIDKLKDASDRLGCEFAALIGTPVPAVIATDFKALTRMAEKRCGLPVIAIDCTGTRLYDQGAADTYAALFKRFAEERKTLDKDGVSACVEAQEKDVLEERDASEGRKIGILGVNPLDTSYLEAEVLLKKKYEGEGYEKVLCYGTSGLQDIKDAGSVEKNLVLSPSGLKAAKQLEKRFGTPYEVCFPILKEEIKAQLQQLTGKKVLIVHQQVEANEIRKEILAAGEADVTVATWFLLDDELKTQGDIHIDTENQWKELAEKNDFDVIIGDKMLKRAARGFKGEWIHLPHFAVSGEYDNE